MQYDGIFGSKGNINQVVKRTETFSHLLINFLFNKRYKWDTNMEYVCDNILRK